MKRTPRDNELSRKRITRRALLLGGAQLSVMAVLALRLRYMQVEQADEFRLLAEENRINVRLIPPVRGSVIDRKGRLIAGNEHLWLLADQISPYLRQACRSAALEPCAVDRYAVPVETQA